MVMPTAIIRVSTVRQRKRGWMILFALSAGELGTTLTASEHRKTSRTRRKLAQ
jgi:hypothetical protein